MGSNHMKQIMEITVGAFIIAGAVALFLLAFKVSGISKYSDSNAIKVTAMFDNIGDLKERAPITVAGVRIGEVKDIKLDYASFRADVTMLIDYNAKLPMDSSASILSASLLGSNYIAITPGFSEETIKNHGEITETHPAIILENLIGQAIFTPDDQNDKDKDK